MNALTLYVRFGDSDDYSEVESIADFVETLRNYGITGPLGRHGEYGVQCEGFRGDNYISLYYGSDVETPSMACPTTICNGSTTPFSIIVP